MLKQRALSSYVACGKFGEHNLFLLHFSFYLPAANIELKLYGELTRKPTV
jgi:hypothetical protein